MFAFNSFNERTLTLTDKEMFFLAGILGFDRILGKENPFSIQNSGVLTTNWKQVAVSLLQKGCLSAEQFEALVTQTSAGEHPFTGIYKRGCCLRYQYKTESGKQLYDSHTYFSSDGVIEIRQAEDLPGYYTLRPMGTLTEACSLVMEKMNLNTYPANEMPALTFSGQWFDDYIRNKQTHRNRQLTNQLSEMTGDLEGSRLFAGVLSENRLYAEVQFSYWDEENWQRKGAILLADDDTNWIVRRSNQDEEDWMIAVPADKVHFRQMLLDWVQQPESV
ncbi:MULTISPECIES: hypothetical protein [Paenibacillus]|uniref:hypothetical protein n=1 Tax=Paenibacillus TaxID=44249 RepID=UPI00035F3EC0|nr:MULTISPECIES: hypothetical protein [Paenibacillus]